MSGSWRTSKLGWVEVVANCRSVLSGNDSLEESQNLMLDPDWANFVIKSVFCFKEGNCGDRRHDFSEPWRGVSVEKLHGEVGEPVELLIVPLLREADKELRDHALVMRHT